MYIEKCLTLIQCFLADVINSHLYCIITITFQSYISGRQGKSLTYKSSVGRCVKFSLIRCLKDCIMRWVFYIYIADVLTFFKSTSKKLCALQKDAGLKARIYSILVCFLLVGRASQISSAPYACFHWLHNLQIVRRKNHQ
jgi:hypothetical protein